MSSGASRGILESGLAELAIHLPNSAIEQLMCYLGELLRWNKKINLTALNTEEAILIKHFLDSLTALPYLQRKPGVHWIDVGTGGGFPGLVLKIAAPEICLTLLEPLGKKVTFLHHMIGLLGMNSVSVIPERIEHLAGSEWDRQYDLMMTRAFSPEILLQEGRDLVQGGGEIVLFQGHASHDSWVSRLGRYPNLYLKKIIALHLPFSEVERTLIVIGVKVSE